MGHNLVAYQDFLWGLRSSLDALVEALALQAVALASLHASSSGACLFGTQPSVDTHPDYFASQH